MMRALDSFLNSTTMYRLVLYVLIALVVIAAVLGAFQMLPYSAPSIILSATVLLGISWAANILIAKAFEVPTNNESAYITALILALIVTPAQSMNDLPLLFWLAILSMASKYLLAINKKHLFNPAAIAVVITGLALGESASWWVGTTWMMPFVAISGWLIIRKLRFEDMAWSFFTSAVVVSLALTVIRGGDTLTTLTQIILHSSFLYLGSIMLTEPLTLPPTRNLQMIYGALVGVLSVPQVHLGGFYFAPELALCIGNMFAYLVSPKTKIVVKLKERIPVSSDIVDFLFQPSERLAFSPGQYMEWTLPHSHPDSRGNRRYFTLASSPTEETIRLGVRFYPHGSSYKNALAHLDSTTAIIGAQIAGDFTLPRDPKQKLVFIAGGVGITPFRSMVKYLLDTHQSRDIILLYSNKTADEIVYTDVFTAAEKELGLRAVYTLTARESVPANWQGKVGRLSKQLVETEVPDSSDRLFYLSGPPEMVRSTEAILHSMNIKSTQIKKDFFPGLI